MTDRQLRLRYPAIPWDEPILLNDNAIRQFWACRYCIATHELRETELEELPSVFETREQVLEHVELVHGCPACGQPETTNGSGWAPFGLSPRRPAGPSRPGR